MHFELYWATTPHDANFHNFFKTLFKTFKGLEIPAFKFHYFSRFCQTVKNLNAVKGILKSHNTCNYHSALFTLYIRKPLAKTFGNDEFSFFQT